MAPLKFCLKNIAILIDAYRAKQIPFFIRYDYFAPCLSNFDFGNSFIMNDDVLIIQRFRTFMAWIKNGLQKVIVCLVSPGIVGIHRKQTQSYLK